MKGYLYIDEMDAFMLYGMSVAKDGLNELLAFPALKAPDTNDWHESDGLEVDLDKPVLDTRECSISFIFSGIFNGFEAFARQMADGAYHIFNFKSIGRTFKLRLVSTPSQEDVWKSGIASFKFADDFPFYDYLYAKPQSTLSPYRDYSIDDTDVSAYGIRILKGTRKELQKIPAVKPNLTIKSKFENGATYDAHTVTFKAKDAKLNCLMRADTLPDLWRNYRGLLHDITQPGKHKLYSDVMDHAFMFFYKNCKINTFDAEQRWLVFTLTITITDNLRLSEGYLLAAGGEGRNLVTVEPDSPIDLTPQISDTSQLNCE